MADSKHHANRANRIVPPSLWDEYLNWAKANGNPKTSAEDGTSDASRAIQKQYLEFKGIAVHTAAKMRRRETGERIPPHLLKSMLVLKGWTPSTLAQRWQLSEGTISRMTNDPQRPPHWDDAFRGLPNFKELAKAMRDEATALKAIHDVLGSKSKSDNKESE